MRELFEIFDSDGSPVGTAPREDAHRNGYWHKASNVFVFSPGGLLLIQQRQSTKDICPGAWDVSAAEHLRPGESFEQGALRGLDEELGIRGVTIAPIGTVVRYRLELQSAGVKDYEFQQSFRVQYDGPVTPDPVEVMATRTISLPALLEAMSGSPAAFTPWFRERVAALRQRGDL